MNPSLAAIACTAIAFGSSLVGWVIYLRYKVLHLASKDRLTTLENDVQKLKTASAIKQELRRT